MITTYVKRRSVRMRSFYERQHQNAPKTSRFMSSSMVSLLHTNMYPPRGPCKGGASHVGYATLRSCNASEALGALTPAMAIEAVGEMATKAARKLYEFSSLHYTGRLVSNYNTPFTKLASREPAHHSLRLTAQSLNHPARPRSQERPLSQERPRSQHYGVISASRVQPVDCSSQNLSVENGFEKRDVEKSVHRRTLRQAGGREAGNGCTRGMGSIAGGYTQEVHLPPHTERTNGSCRRGNTTAPHGVR